MTAYSLVGSAVYWNRFTAVTRCHDSIQFIQFNSVRVYLRANLIAQRPITKLARVYRSTQKELKNKIYKT
jgi:hypothetical protein